MWVLCRFLFFCYAHWQCTHKSWTIVKSSWMKVLEHRFLWQEKSQSKEMRNKIVESVESDWVLCRKLRTIWCWRKLMGNNQPNHLVWICWQSIEHFFAKEWWMRSSPRLPTFSRCMCEKCRFAFHQLQMNRIVFNVQSDTKRTLEKPHWNRIKGSNDWDRDRAKKTYILLTFWIECF